MLNIFFFCFSLLFLHKNGEQSNGLIEMWIVSVGSYGSVDYKCWVLISFSPSNPNEKLKLRRNVQGEDDDIPVVFLRRERMGAK